MDHAAIIGLWPSLGEFAIDIGVSYGTAKAMRRRGSIPSGYWAATVAAAAQREIPDVTLEALAASAAKERFEPREPQAVNQ